MQTLYPNTAKTIHVALTGHRPNKLGGYNLEQQGYKALQKDLELFIEELLPECDAIVGHSGMALGADTIWSKAILAMKEKFPGRVFLHLEIPMLEQPEAWFKKSDVDFWHQQYDNADGHTIYGSLANKSDAERKRLASVYLNNRNHGMMDACSIALAVWDGTSGGTGNAVKYAKSQKKDLRIVHPQHYFST